MLANAGNQINAEGAAAGALAASLAATVLQETFSDSAKIQAGGKIIGGIAGAFATNNAKGANSGANSGEITIVYNHLAHALSMMEKEVPGTIKAHEESRKRLCAQSPNVCKMVANTLSFGADFLPVFGVIKSFKEAETAIDYLAATAGLLPGAGPAAGKMIKSANTALKHGDLETANKLIQQTRNELAVLQKNGATSSTNSSTKAVNSLNKPDGAGYYRVNSNNPLGLTGCSDPKKWDIDSYGNLRDSVKGKNLALDSHHVGQKAIMKDLVKNYDPKTGPSILVPKVGHTVSKNGLGIVSRSRINPATGKEFTNARV